MSEPKNLPAKTEKKEEGISAKEVILNLQRAAMNLDDIIHHVVKPKHPDKYICRPSQERARNNLHEGWEMLKYIPESQDVKVVKSMDEASTTQTNVLAWRDMRIQEYIEKKEAEKRAESNRRASAESDSRHQAKGLQDSLTGLGGGTGKLEVSPLTLKDE